MLSRENKIRLVTRLHRDTVEGKIAWAKSGDRQNRTDQDLLTSAVYETRYENLTFRLYRVQEPYRRFDSDDPIWSTRHILEIRDHEGDSIGEIGLSDLVPDLRSLFDVVRASVADINTALSKLIEKEPTHAQ